MFSLNMMDYPMFFISLSTWNYFWVSSQVEGTILRRFYYLGFVVGPSFMLKSCRVGDGLQNSSFSPRPLETFLVGPRGFKRPRVSFGARTWQYSINLLKITFRFSLIPASLFCCLKLNTVHRFISIPSRIQDTFLSKKLLFCDQWDYQEIRK